jgi:hypothetical protein
LAAVTPVCAIIDGHVSHKEVAAWQRARREKKAAGFFIGSKTSADGQVPDNGSNSLVGAVFHRANAKVTHQKLAGAVGHNVSLANDILYETWCEAIFEIGRATLNASRKTGWYYESGQRKLIGIDAENYQSLSLFGSGFETHHTLIPQEMTILSNFFTSWEESTLQTVLDCLC